MAYLLFSHRSATAASGGTAANASDNVFSIGSINNEDSDPSSIATLTSNQITLPTGTYRVRGIITFGHAGSMLGMQGRAILYNETDNAVITNASGGQNIVSTPLVASTASATGSTLANATCEIAGRFTLAGAKAITIRIAGDANTGTWATGSGAQGAPASSITSGSYQNLFKQLEFLQE